MPLSKADVGAVSTTKDSKRRLAEMKSFAFIPALLVAVLMAATSCTSGSLSIRPSVTEEELTQMELQVLMELNAARTAPARYAEAYIKGSSDDADSTEASRECYAELMQAEAAGALTLSEAMSKAAEYLVKDQGPRGAIGHLTSDGLDPFQRLEKYGTWQKSAAENISYGSYHAREVVVGLLIDEGVPSRGHRENILNPAFTKVGISCGDHKKYGTMCVMIFAEGYEER